MKQSLLTLAAFLTVMLFAGWQQSPVVVLASGAQPRLSLDASGTVRLVFGRADSVFFSSLADGARFTEPMLVARVPQLHLGMARGPQLASSAHFSLVTAMDKLGNLHCYQLSHATGTWQEKGMVNDKTGTAPEGLMALAADKQDHFYAVWLDVRHGKTNNICFAAFDPATGTWSRNKLIYISPDGHVCECCRPSISVKGKQVAIMFRNWLHGSRDLYLITSTDNGKTFGKAQKLGTGTWKLNGCPMDGGGLAITGNGNEHTAWQREGTVYYCQPGKPEVNIAKGRTCGLAMNDAGTKIELTLQDEATVKLVDVQTKEETEVGKGNFLNAVVLPDGTTVCAWEHDRKYNSGNYSRMGF